MVEQVVCKLGGAGLHIMLAIIQPLWRFEGIPLLHTSHGQRNPERGRGLETHRRVAKRPSESCLPHAANEAHSSG